MLAHIGIFGAIALTFGSTTAADAPARYEVRPLTDSIVLVHVDEGHVEHHLRGQKRSDERVVVDPLDVASASSPTSYTITSRTDPSFRKGRRPLRIGRKSKGTDFAWFADRWVNGAAVNDRPDHTKEHWIYLFLPRAMQAGARYLLSINKRSQPIAFTYDPKSVRSDAIHTNLLGYAPAAPGKYGYVYQWLGDLGGLDLRPYAGRRFWLVEKASGKAAFEGKLALRKLATNQETFHKSDSPPNGNFSGADIYECDFSAFRRPGSYVLSVDGIGASDPFVIAPDAYREAFRTTVRGLYHNRSGIALTKPYTEFSRPAPHNPNVTPGFKGRLQYTSVRMQEWGSEGGDKERLAAGIRGPLEAWGWYQDAGDWDSYPTHLRVATELLLAYEMNPKAFSDGELNIPESGNGIPDILDEAAWLPRFCYRLRQELLQKKYGTGGIGLRIAGDAFGSDTGPNDVGRGSWEDVDRTWVASGEDPLSTFRYAGAAAHLAYALQIAGKEDPGGVDWRKEAQESYAWATANTRPSDEQELKDHRMYASAALFRLTGDPSYEARFLVDAAAIGPDSTLWETLGYGPFVYALGKPGLERDAAALERIRSAILHTGDASCETAERRGLRFGGNYWFPMLVGQQTTPWVLETAVAYTLSKRPRYLATLYTTADYCLGTNPLGMTWVTGLGPRHPNQAFHMDAWYNGKGKFHPGIIPYGPWRKERDLGQGPWDVAWPHKTVYPAIDNWPGAERWFDNRCSPMNSEFTIHQNTGPAAALYGFLCAPK